MKRTKPIKKILKSAKTPKTPKQAILDFCFECVGRKKEEIKTCDGNHLLEDKKECVFFKFRLGQGRPSIKLIRQQCLDCMGENRRFVSECTNEDCPLFKYRFGTNPARGHRKNRSKTGG